MSFSTDSLKEAKDLARLPIPTSVICVQLLIILESDIQKNYFMKLRVIAFKPVSKLNPWLREARPISVKREALI